MLNCVREILDRLTHCSGFKHGVALLLAVPMIFACACSTSKNTASSRRWQAFTTRYNVYYNGSEHYKEQLKSMEQSYQDDYSRRVLMHPAEAHADPKMTKPSGDFKRTIEKMQKAIQLHSITKKPKKRTSTPKDKAFRAREEFNPFIHNAWLMMGRAQYYNGDFLGAASTFFYISRHFKWLPNVVDEAKLWQVRSYLALDWLYEAENILTHIKRDKLASKSLQELYDFDRANYLVRSGQKAEAVSFLAGAAKSAHGSQRNRLYYLLGQVQKDLGNKQQAYEAFAQAGKGSGTDYRTKFNARIAQSEVFTGTDINKEVKALKAMARYQRNNEYQDQIYYAIGNLYLTRKDSVNAEKNYALAIEKSVNGGINKALAQLALGALYFQKHDYVKAQPLYSEAVPALSDNYPGYKAIKLRSDVLDELATYSGNVQLQDSLLALSKLPEEEQLKVAERLAAEYVKKQKEAEEEARRQEALAEAAAQGDPIAGKDNQPNRFQMNTDKSWYFYNAQTKAAGKTEFQRRWGARKLEDDWRRRNKNTFSFEDTDTSDEDENGSVAANDSIPEEQKQILEAQSDPGKPEYYLKNIPHTELEVKNANDIVQEGLYNLGVILKDKLEDFKEARSTFNDLDKRYPDNIYRLDVYYNMYLMDVRQNNAAGAETWRQLIIKDFPDSPYGQAMEDPAYFDNLRRMDEVQEQMYQQAYEAYLSDDNERVHRLTAEMEEKYPLSKILPKFVFIDALSYVTDKDEGKFKDRLSELLQKWPDTDMTSMASDMLKYLNAGRKLNSGGGNMKGMLWETRLTNDNGPEGTLPDGTPANFDLDPNKPQLLVLAFPLDSISPNQLLFDVARHNFSSFVVKDFDLEQMNFGNVGLLIIKGFANMKELEHYRTVMARDDTFTLPEQVRPIMISVANFELLLREGRSFEEYFRFEQDATMRQKEQLEHSSDEDSVPLEDGDTEPDEEGDELPISEEEKIAPEDPESETQTEEESRLQTEESSPESQQEP